MFVEVVPMIQYLFEFTFTSLDNSYVTDTSHAVAFETRTAGRKLSCDGCKLMFFLFFKINFLFLYWQVSTVNDSTHIVQFEKVENEF